MLLKLNLEIQNFRGHKHTNQTHINNVKRNTQQYAYTNQTQTNIFYFS